MMNRKLLLLALACLAASAYAAQGQVYKWTDAAGVVHYSDAPPPKDALSVQTVRVTGGDRPHAVTPENAEAGAAPADANAKAPPAQNASPADADVRTKNCQTAQSNLEMLQSKMPVSVVTGADGKPQPLDDKERQAQITYANAQIALYCK